jgi:hypothetical protein
MAGQKNSQRPLAIKINTISSRPYCISGESLPVFSGWKKKKLKNKPLPDGLGGSFLLFPNSRESAIF